MSVNFGDVFETVADVLSDDAPAVICDGVTVGWRTFEAQSNALARRLVDGRMKPGDKVALFMRNGPAYMVAFAACLKARLVPVNINYRYGPAEVAYLLRDSDAEAAIASEAFASTLDEAAGPSVRIKVCADGSWPGWDRLDRIVQGDSRPLEIQRDPEDIFLLYTGGTTGMPKGVMWPSSSVWGALAASRAGEPGASPPMDLQSLREQIRRLGPGPRYYIAPPLMHGTGLFSALSVMNRGGAVVCSGAASFDPDHAIDEIIRHRCEGLVIVGDAFAQPIAATLRRRGSDTDLSFVKAVVSSGMMWSPAIKLALLEFMPNAALSDGYGASEAAGIGFSVVTRDIPPQEARFTPSDAIVVRPDDLSPVTAGSGEIGVIAKTGNLPLGYYKDPERTARTYVQIRGVRYMVGGDHATLEADGTIRLLGRGSHCINTAGEKVYPEEVEEALKTHPGVTDALVFGLPDPRFGEVIAAVISGEALVDRAAVVQHVRARLAAYKAPRHVVVVDQAPRAANGKADYPAARALFKAAVESGVKTDLAR